MKHLLLTLALCVLPGSAFAEPEPTVAIASSQRMMASFVTEDVAGTLRRRQWGKAVDALRAVPDDQLVGDSKAAHAFVLAWSLVHSDQAVEAAPLIERFMGAEEIPGPYAALVEAEVLLATDAAVDALKVLEQIPEDSVLRSRARLTLARTLEKLERRKEATEVYAEVANGAPGEGTAKALVAYARLLGHGSEPAYPVLRRIWTEYPQTDHSRQTWEALKAYGRNPTREEQAKRAEQLMYQGSYATAIAETDALVAGLGEDVETDCRLLYVRGRSAYKQNRLTSSVGYFADAPSRCVEGPGETRSYGAKAAYLLGTAQFRKKQYASSAKTFEILGRSYGEHSMADDGYTHAGIGLLEAGDLEGARKMWELGLETYPDGDTVAESTWRLAWALYLDHRTDDARQVAERLGNLSTAVDRVHVLAGRYWAARWKLYPDVDAPTKPVDDATLRQEAVDEWAALCREYPRSFYAIQAYSRLADVAPEVAKQVSADVAPKRALAPGRPWRVRTELAHDPRMQTGVALARLGLIQEAQAEWSAAEHQPETADEKAWLTEWRIASGDWLLAHDDFRRFLKKHPVGTHGDGEPEALRVAYPDRYWEHVQKVAADYHYPPRLFHGLTREESNFNKDIVSFAGARGLSQVMPATAKQTAGWMKMTITMDEMFEPWTNLKIGSRYFESVYTGLSNSPYLATAAYNAGPGRVKQWHGEWGNVPTDEYVERIPYRETRGYVKRVMGTWQTYRFQFDHSEDPFPDLSRLNHQVRPAE